MTRALVRQIVSGLAEAIGCVRGTQVADPEDLTNQACQVLGLHSEEEITVDLFDFDGSIEAYADRLFDTTPRLRTLK